MLLVLVGGCLNSIGMDPVLVGTWPGHKRWWAQDVEVTNNLAYIAAGTGGLLIMDVRNPSDPKLVGKLETKNATALTVSDNLACVVTEGGQWWLSKLELVDVTDPSNPILRGTYNTDSLFYDVAVAGDLAIVVGYGVTCDIVDIKDPANPALLRKLDTRLFNYGVTVVDNLAYIIGEELRIFDISDPLNPTRVSVFSMAGEHVTVVNGYAYLSGANGLHIANVSQPWLPKYVGGYNTFGTAYDFELRGNLAFVADGNTGLQVLDVSDPQTPNRISQQDTPGSALAIELHENVAVIADSHGGLRFVDISSPTNLAHLATFAGNGESSAIALQGNTAFIADGTAGLRILDVSDRRRPVEIGTYKTTAAAKGITVNNDFAFLALGKAGLEILSITNLSNPHKVGLYYAVVSSSVSAVNGVLLNGNRAFVAEDGSLAILDVTDPARPRRLGWYNSGGLGAGVKDIALVGHLALLACGGSVQIVDVSDETRPVRVTSYASGLLPHSAQGVESAGNIAYIADGRAGLEILDIANPAQPIRLGGFDTTNDATSIELAGNLVFLTESKYGVHIIDVTDPRSPVRVGGFASSGEPLGLLHREGYVFLAEGSDGLSIVDTTKLAVPELAFEWANGLPHLHLKGLIGRRYSIEQTGRFGPQESWMPWQTFSLEANPKTFSDFPYDDAATFYRARLLN